MKGCPDGVPHDRQALEHTVAGIMHEGIRRIHWSASPAQTYTAAGFRDVQRCFVRSGSVCFDIVYGRAWHLTSYFTKATPNYTSGFTALGTRWGKVCEVCQLLRLLYQTNGLICDLRRVPNRPSGLRSIWGP
jgi:hypothetical protein